MSISKKTLHQQMDAIAKSLEGKETSSGNTFLSNYQQVDRALDKEWCDLDSQDGLSAIWVVKGNGAGTYLITAGKDQADAVINSMGEDSLFYHVDSDGINSGSVIQVDKKQAVDIALRPIDPSIEPRRTNMLVGLEENLKLEHAAIFHSAFASEVPSDEGAVYVVRAGLSGNGNAVLDVVATNKGVAEFAYGVHKKDRDTYFIPLTLEGARELIEGDKHMLITMGKSGNATIKEVGPEFFDRAVRNNVNKEVENTLGR